MARRIRRNRPGRPLATRLFTAQALIVASGALTRVVVAVVIAPGLFRDHLQRAVRAVPPDLAQHLDQALARALLISLGIAVAAALATSLAVSWFITRRLTRPVAAMASAATRIADGDYQTRVPPSRLGVEFAMLDNAFNRMAATLHATEHRRRELADTARTDRPATPPGRRRRRRVPGRGTPTRGPTRAGRPRSHHHRGARRRLSRLRRQSHHAAPATRPNPSPSHRQLRGAGPPARVRRLVRPGP